MSEAPSPESHALPTSSPPSDYDNPEWTSRLPEENLGVAVALLPELDRLEDAINNAENIVNENLSATAKNKEKWIAEIQKVRGQIAKARGGRGLKAPMCRR